MLQEIKKKNTETGFNKVFLKAKRSGKDLNMDVFELKHIEDKCDNTRKHHGNGQCSVCNTPLHKNVKYFISEFIDWNENPYMNCKMVP